MPGSPYKPVLFKLSQPLVTMPVLPNKRMAESDSTKGGETTGKIETALNNPFTAFEPVLTYASTYANKKPIRVAAMPVIIPKNKVFVIAVLNECMFRILKKMSSVKRLSTYMLSTSKMLNGYKIKRNKNKKMPAITVIKNGSANNFFLSSSFFCEEDITIPVIKEAPIRAAGKGYCFFGSPVCFKLSLCTT